MGCQATKQKLCPGLLPPAVASTSSHFVDVDQTSRPAQTVAVNTNKSAKLPCVSTKTKMHFRFLGYSSKGLSRLNRLAAVRRRGVHVASAKSMSAVKFSVHDWFAICERVFHYKHI